MMEPADVVLRFLESVVVRSEAEFYVSLFCAEAKERFAAISVDANVARHATEAVVLDLRFLAGLGLCPVVIFGLLEPTHTDEDATRIRQKLEKAGVAAAVLWAPSPVELYAQTAAAARSGVIPIISLQASDDATPDARFEHLGALLSALGTRKMIFLHRPGGLRPDGSLVPLVNLTTEYDSLAAAKGLSRKEHTLLAQSRRLVFDLVPHKLVVAIASPLDLLRELFTVRGAGTLLRRGAVIVRHEGLGSVDLERLKTLLASSFGQAPRDSFFETSVSRVYLEEGYRSVAIMVDTPLGAYLSKFAVEREAQGEGMGRDLWNVVAAEYPAFFWRARADNPIVTWYAKLCDGLARFPEWHVFWKGLEPEAFHAAVRYALKQPTDFSPL